jgi:hypothetical protein
MAGTSTGARTHEPLSPRRAAPRTGHIILLVLGVLLAGSGLVLTGLAAALGVAVSQRSSGGYAMSSTQRYTVDSYAITSEQLDVVLDQGVPSNGFRWPETRVIKGVPKRPAQGRRAWRPRWST